MRAKTLRSSCCTRRRRTTPSTEGEISLVFIVSALFCNVFLIKFEFPAGEKCFLCSDSSSDHDVDSREVDKAFDEFSFLENRVSSFTFRESGKCQDSRLWELCFFVMYWFKRSFFWFQDDWKVDQTALEQLKKQYT